MTSAHSSQTIQVLLVALIGSIACMPNEDRPEHFHRHKEANLLLEQLAGVKIKASKPKADDMQLKLF